MANGKIKADTLEHSTAGSLDTQYVVNGSAKAWSSVQADQSTQNDSLNVSSVSDAGVGLCQRNFINSFASNPFGNTGLSVEQLNNAGFSRFSDTSSAGSIQTNVRNTSNAQADHQNSCLILGDLA